MNKKQQEAFIEKAFENFMKQHPYLLYEFKGMEDFVKRGLGIAFKWGAGVGSGALDLVPQKEYTKILKEHKND